MLVMVIGLSGLLVGRIQLRSAEGADESAAARLYAQSAIELGFTMIHKDTAWRDSLGEGLWITDQAIGAGTMSLEASFVDDGDENPDNDPVLLVGTGVVGAAQHRMQVTLLPDRGGMMVSPASWQQKVD
jgi:hypothetical protein